jgi:outer membrane protein OmpA-like peptidoglycan-associated protein
MGFITSGLRFRIGRAAPATLVVLLSGCSSFPASMNPVTWWHDLQGGKIAEDRPPPPGADEPYPNLATVPAKPTEPDRAALANITNALIADRTNTQHLNAAAPLADPSSPSASPALFGKGTVPPPPPAPPPGTATASASLPAAEAQPAAPSPAASQGPATPAPAPAAPARAPVGAVQSTALAPPGAAAQPAAEAGPPPQMSAAPPPPANLAGAPAAPSRPATAAAPAPASEPGSPQAVNAPATDPASTVSVAFTNGSAALSATADDTLKRLAARRGAGTIVITGYGDDTASDPNAQSAALTLGLSRAQAMASALVSAGVPGSAVQVGAEASGRGGTARLVQ